MRSKLSMKKKTAAFVSAGIITVGAAGAAFAYWTNSGSGTGEASTGTTVAITVNQTDSSDNSLFPGGPATTLSGDFDNPNDGPIYVHQVTATIDEFTSSEVDPLKPACTEDDFQLDVATVTVDAEVPSGVAKGAWSGINLSMKNPSTNQDNCKDVTVPLSFTSN